VCCFELFGTAIQYPSNIDQVNKASGSQAGVAPKPAAHAFCHPNRRDFASLLEPSGRAQCGTVVEILISWTLPRRSFPHSQ